MQRLGNARSDINKQLENKNLTAEKRSALIEKRALYAGATLDYLNRLNEISETRLNLQTQKTKLVETKNEITED